MTDTSLAAPGPKSKPHTATSEADRILASSTGPDPTSEPPKRSRGRPKGSKNKSEKSATKADTEIQARSSAQLYNQLFFSTCVRIGGEPMAPNPGEKKELDNVLGEYLITRPGLDLPAGFIVAMVYTNYLIHKTNDDDVKKTMKEKFANVRTTFKYLRDKFRNKRAARKEVKPNDTNGNDAT